MKPVALAATLALFVLGDKAHSHEFWIDPEAYMLAAGETLEADLRVGEEFRGAALSYLPRNFETYFVRSGEQDLVVDGRLGDIPALSLDGVPDGLAVIVHQTGVNNLTWDEWERFLRFAEHKDLGDVTAMHDARGLSQEGVREDYIRYAKSLVAVDDGAGADARFGLFAEMVALTNPYSQEFDGTMAVELWYDGLVQADTQVEVFAEDAEGNVEITLARTDENGIARVPVAPGVTYMFDSVFLEAVEPQSEGDAIWVTHWANLTFAVPE